MSRLSRAFSAFCTEFNKITPAMIEKRQRKLGEQLLAEIASPHARKHFDLINQDADLTVTDAQGRTALACAIHNNRTDIALALIKKGADVNITDKDGYSLLVHAIRKGQKDVTLALIEHGANVNMRNERGDTLLDNAIKNERLDIAMAVIANGADTNRGEALRLSLERKQDTVATALINKGAFISADLLSLALKKGAKNAVQAMLDKNVDMNGKDREGNIPLIAALEHDQPAFAQQMIEKGADVNVKNGSGDTFLFTALKHRKPDLVRLAVEKGAQTRVRDKNGNTPLITALLCYQNNAAQWLVEKAGVDLNEKNLAGETPLTTALKNKQSVFARFLIEKGADVRVKDGNSNSPLALAALYDYTDIVKLIQAKGVSIEMTICEQKVLAHKEAATALRALHQEQVNDGLLKSNQEMQKQIAALTKKTEALSAQLAAQTKPAAAPKPSTL